MPLDLAVVAEFAIACALLAGGLIVIGFPVKALLLDGPHERSPVPSLVAGLAVVQVVTWYWLQAGGEGLKTPIAVLLGAGAAGTLFAVIRRGVRWPGRELLTAAVGPIAAVIVFVVVFASIFDLPFHTTSTLGNLDAIEYSIDSQHLTEHGFGDPGQVSDLGERAKKNGFGSIVVLGAASAATGIATWKLTTPLMFILVILGVATLARLLRELFPDAPVQSGLAAAAACAGYLFFYLVGMYFLGQVMGMAVAPILGVAALRARNCASVRSGVRLAASVAVVTLVYLSHYIHMLVPVVLLFGAAALAASWGEIRTVLPRIAAVGGAGLLAAFVIIPGLAIQHVALARTFAVAAAGWPLPGFLPSEVAGALGDPPTPHGAGGYAASAMLLAGFAASLLALRNTRRRAALFAGTTVGLILLTYLAVYLHEGVSYRQWKWITFFQPLFAALIFIVVTVAVTDRAVVHRLRAAVPAACVALGVLTAAIVAMSGFAHTPAHPSFLPGQPTDQTLAYVDPDLSNLGVNPKLARLGPINVDIAPNWDTMWAVYFLRNHPLTAQSASYFPTAPPTAEWTLTPRNDALASPSFQVVNKRFQLERRFTGPTSATADGLDARITPAQKQVVVTAGAPIRLTAKITNDGSAAWLASGTPPGSVNVGGRLETAGGREIQHDFSHLPVVPGRTAPIPPGATATTVLDTPSPLPGRYRLVLQMVSEGVKWFGPKIPIDLTVQSAG
jgi:hypothetical protein